MSSRTYSLHFRWLQFVNITCLVKMLFTNTCKCLVKSVKIKCDGKKYLKKSWEIYFIQLRKGKHTIFFLGGGVLQRMICSMVFQLQTNFYGDKLYNVIVTILHRSVVMQFNQRLIGRLLSQTSLKWLDFVDNLLTKESGELKLKKQYGKIRKIISVILLLNCLF